MFSMKSIRSLLILLGLALLGGLLGYNLATKEKTQQAESHPPVIARGEAEARPTRDLPEMVQYEAAIEPDLNFPPNAVRGELVVRFNSRSEYLDFLQALAEAGLQPLGQIDGLLAVRIPSSALLQARLGQYEAEAEYAYRVEQPPSPVQIAPEDLARLRAFDASARFITGEPLMGDGRGVKIAILDSGIVAHPYLDGVEIVSLGLSGDRVDGAGASHGTSVASIIAGREGIAPAAELFVVRVLDEEGLGNSFHVAEGIVRAVDQGAQLINLSLGVYQDSPLLRQAVRYAHQQGVIMVAAAGNDGFDRLPFPAAYSEVLAVTAVDAGGQQALFPNQSKSIDFAAPGVGILAADEEGGMTLFSGTSAAAPFVTGSLASLLSGENPSTPHAAVELMRSYLNEQGAPGLDPVYGAGVLDWDRLRERSTPGITDVALADIYLPSNSIPGTNTPVEVIVQNRGTKWLSGAELEVFVGEAKPVSFTLGSLGPGQTTTRQVVVQVPSKESAAALEIVARVKPENLQEDVRLENNVKAVSFRPSF
ncbi:MAG: hypothetical protein EA353_03220 [Puniceicoccaceae bacterium]|nr:MAG: hypothetical protein EA353_03220 [Puniceicoccaceae bacterium]